MAFHAREVFVVVAEIFFAGGFEAGRAGENAPDVHGRRGVGAVAREGDGEGVAC